MVNFTEVYSNYLIYFSASTNKRYVDYFEAGFYLLDISILYYEPFVPIFAPFFEENFQELIITE